MSDGTWKTVPQTSGYNRKRSVIHSGQTIECVERAETSSLFNI